MLPRFWPYTSMLASSHTPFMGLGLWKWEWAASSCFVLCFTLCILHLHSLVWYASTRHQPLNSVSSVRKSRHMKSWKCRKKMCESGMQFIGHIDTWKKVKPPPPECWNQTSYKTGCLVSLETAQTLIFISDIQTIGEDCLCYHRQWRSSWLYFLMTFYPDMSQSLHVFCCLIDRVCEAHDSNSEFVNFTSDWLLKSLNLQLWMKRRPRRCKLRLSPVFLELARCSRSSRDFHWNCRVAKTVPSEHLRLYCFIIHKTSWVTARPDGRRK